MGAEFTKDGIVPVFERDVSNFGQYDYWGFIPLGSQPSQHDWHTWYTRDNAAGRMNLRRKEDDRPWREQYGLVNSITENILKNKLWTQDELGGYLGVTGEGVAGDLFAMQPNPGVRKQPGYAWYEYWKDQQKSLDEQKKPGAICNPMNFPYCSMKLLKDGEPEFYDYAGEFYSGIELWQKTVDDVYTKFYASNNCDMLDQINNDDTSAYDPCAQPGFLAQAMPLVLGGLSAGAFQKYFATDLRAVFSEATMNTWSVGTFLFGFFFMRGAMDVYGSEGENLSRAATSISVPVGMWLGDYFINQGYNAQPNSLYAVGVGIGLLIVQPILDRVLHLPAPLSFVLHLVGGLFNVIGTFICRLVSSRPDACAAVDSNGEKIFPTARRWDATSIAAKLTDEIRVVEGWDRSDPRSEFCFKAFLTGPALLDAARPADDPNRVPMWEGQFVGDPLGSIYAPGLVQRYWNGTYRMLYGVGSVYGWDGARTGWADVANHNHYACQNWEIVRGIAVGEKPLGEEGRQLKDRFDLWVKTVKDMANDPKALTHAGIGKDFSAIPGWKGGTDTLASTRAALTTAQWLERIDQIYRSLTLKQRYDEVYNWQDIYMPPRDPAILFWLEANEAVYTYVVLKPDKTLDDLVGYVLGMFSSFNKTPATLSATFFAAAATTGSDEIAKYWSDFPAQVRDAIMEFPPPKTAEGTTLPFGVFPAGAHWHRMTPTNTPTTGNSVCALNLARIQNPTNPNDYNNSISNMLNIVRNILADPNSCKNCSVAQMGTLVSYLSCFTAQAGNFGVGFVCEDLQSMGWNDNNISAALHTLKTPVVNQQYLTLYLELFWNLPVYNGKDWSTQIAAWLEMNGRFSTDLPNVCEDPQTPLTALSGTLAGKPVSTIEKWSLRDTETVLPWGMQALTEKWANRHLYAPPAPGQGFDPIYWPHGGSGLRHETPPPQYPAEPISWPGLLKVLTQPPPVIVSDPLPTYSVSPSVPTYPGIHSTPIDFTDECAKVVAYLQDGSRGTPNASLTQLQAAVDSIFGDPNLKYCTCNPQALGAASTYAQMLLGTSADWSVGDFLAGVTGLGPWSWLPQDQAAGLHVAAGPVHKQVVLSEGLAEFWKNTTDKTGKDWSGEIQQLMTTFPNAEFTEHFKGVGC